MGISSRVATWIGLLLLAVLAVVATWMVRWALSEHNHAADLSGQARASQQPDLRSKESYEIEADAGDARAMTILGYMLGEVAIVRRHFEKFVLLIIFVSLLPVTIHALRAKSGTANSNPDFQG